MEDAGYAIGTKYFLLDIWYGDAFNINKPYPNSLTKGGKNKAHLNALQTDGDAGQCLHKGRLPLCQHQQGVAGTEVARRAPCSGDNTYI